MSNKNTIAIEIVVNDNGTATIKNFGTATAGELKKVAAAGDSLGAGFAKTWAGISAGAASAVYIFQQVKDAVTAPIAAYAASESAVLKLGMAMKNQGDFSRAALEDLEEYAGSLQMLTAYEDDLAIAVMGNLKSYGMTNEEVKRATRTAMDFATAKANEGMTITTASELIGKAYAGNTQMLGRYGITIADTIPKSEKFAAVMDQLNARFGGSAQAELATYAGQWKQIQNQWGDVQEFLGLVLLKTIEGVGFGFSMMSAGFWSTLEKLVNGLGWFGGKFQAFLDMLGTNKESLLYKGVAGFNAQMKETGSIYGDIKNEALRMADNNFKAMTSFDNVTKAVEGMGIAGKRTQAIDEEATRKKKEAEQSIVEAIRKSSYEIEGIGNSQYDKAIARINAEAAKYEAAGADKVKIAQFVAAQTAVAAREESIREREAQDEAWQRFRDLRAKENEETAKGAEEYRKIVSAEYEFGATEQERAVNAILAKEREKFEKLDDLYFRGYISYAEYEDARATIATNTQAAIVASDQKTSIERLKIERDLYSDIRGYETDYYDASVKLLEDQAAAYRKEGASEVAVAAWKAEEMAKLDLRRLKSSDKFVDGVKAGYKEMIRNQETWAKTGLAVFDSFNRGASSQLSANLVNVFRGNFGEIGFDWASLQDSMIVSFSNSLGKMMTEAAINEIVLFFKTTWAQGGSNVLGIIDKILGLGTSLLGGSDSNESYLGAAFGDQYSFGGRVPALAGAAPYAGDHPGNDTVLAWLSPDEMVIRRTSVNDRTIGILDYINRTGTVPGLAYGGIPGIVTREQGRGYWGFGDIFGSVMGAVFNPIASFADWGADQVGSAYDWVADNVLTNENLGMLARAAAVAMAYYVGGPYGSVVAAGTAGAQQAAISSSKGASFSDSIKQGLISALATYAAIEFLQIMASQSAGATPDYGWSAGMGGSGEVGLASRQALEYGSTAFIESAQSLGLSEAQALSLWNTSLGGSSAWGGAIRSRALEVLARNAGLRAVGFGKGLAAQGLGLTSAGGAGGYLSLSYEGADDNGLLASLASEMRGMRQDRTFAFSARDGLDYVPYDDFPVLTHKGERIQTAKEAEATRRGAGRATVQINSPLIYIGGNLIADRQTFDEFVEKIDVALDKKWRLVRGQRAVSV